MFDQLSCVCQIAARQTKLQCPPPLINTVFKSIYTQRQSRNHLPQNVCFTIFIYIADLFAGVLFNDETTRSKETPHVQDYLNECTLN